MQVKETLARVENQLEFDAQLYFFPYSNFMTIKRKKQKTYRQQHFLRGTKFRFPDSCIHVKKLKIVNLNDMSLLSLIVHQRHIITCEMYRKN
jgi:hypothetical protein